MSQVYHNYSEILNINSAQKKEKPLPSSKDSGSSFYLTILYLIADLYNNIISVLNIPQRHKLNIAVRHK